MAPAENRRTFISVEKEDDCAMKKPRPARL
jgi:hypothetical protein